MPERPSDLPPALAAAWGATPTDTRRGPKPSLTLATIVTTAVELADEDGHAPSLTRVAKRLRVTTNALYRYLDARSELDALVGEHAMGPPPAPGAASPADDWQGRVRHWVRALRARHEAHPWLVEVQVSVPMLPQTLGWLDTLLDILLGAGMSMDRALRAALLVEGYVRAMVVRERAAQQAAEVAQTSWYAPEHIPAVAAMARDRGLTHVAVVLEGSIFESSAPLGDEEFEAGLDLILTGLERSR